MSLSDITLKIFRGSDKTGDTLFKSVELFDKSLKAVGINDAATNSACLTTTRIGARAESWLDTTFHKAARVALEELAYIY